MKKVILELTKHAANQTGLGGCRRRLLNILWARAMALDTNAANLFLRHTDSDSVDSIHPYDDLSDEEFCNLLKSSGLEDLLEELHAEAIEETEQPNTPANHPSSDG